MTDKEVTALIEKHQTLIEEIATLRPETHFDETFSARLRANLLKDTQPVVMVSPIQDVKPSVESPFTRFLLLDYFHSRLASGAVGALIAVIIITPLTYMLTKRAEIGTPLPFESYVKNNSAKVSLKQQINSKGTNAFGTLSYVAGGKGGAGDVSVPATNSLGVNTKMMEGGRGGIPGGMPMPYSGALSYKYTGSEIKLTETEGTVYKRVKGLESSKQLNEVVQNGKFALTNLGSFKNLNLQNIQLSENKPFGYLIDVNFSQGMIAINPNWSQWNPNKVREPLLASDAPSNDTLISIANAFIQEHGIDTSLYGKPVVENKTYDTFDESGKRIAYVQESIKSG